MNLHIYTSAEKSAAAAERWKNQYYAGGIWGQAAMRSSEAIYKDIVEANGNPNLIAKAIGNTSWSHVQCDCCEQDQDIVVQIGESDIANACQHCLGAALAAIEAVVRRK